MPGLAMAVVGMLLLTRIDQDTSYWALVFPAMAIMSVGLAGVFIPAAEHRHSSGSRATTRASRPRCSTPRSRSVAPSAPRC